MDKAFSNIPQLASKHGLNNDKEIICILPLKQNKKTPEPRENKSDELPSQNSPQVNELLPEETKNNGKAFCSRGTNKMGWIDG